MSRRNDANKDVLSKIHEQIVKDQNNDSTQTGSFPVVRRKPKRVSLNAKATRARLYSSVLVTVLCALLGFSYAIQLNNTTSTYETMSEDELTKLISETSTQVQKLEQRKSELSNQLDSLKDTADKNEKAAEIARQNAESNGILSGRYQYPAKAWSSVFPKDQSEILTRRFYSPYLRNYAIAARKSLKSTIFA